MKFLKFIIVVLLLMIFTPSNCFGLQRVEETINRWESEAEEVFNGRFRFTAFRSGRLHEKFTEEEFQKFVNELVTSSQKVKIFLKKNHKRFLTKLSLKDSMWGYQATVVFDGSKRRVSWKTREGNDGLDYMYLDDGYIERNDYLKSYFLKNGSNYESYGHHELRMIPELALDSKSSLNLKKLSDERSIIDLPGDKKCQFHPETGFVYSIQAKRPDGGTDFWLQFLPFEIDGMLFPQVRIRATIISNELAKLYVEIADKSECRVNTILDADDFVMKGKPGYKIVDTRSGDDETLVSVTADGVKDVIKSANMFRVHKNNNIDQEKKQGEKSKSFSWQSTIIAAGFILLVLVLAYWSKQGTR